MLDSLSLLRIAGEKSSASATAHSVIARNIANADTPGFRALGIESFKSRFTAENSASLRTTRAEHMFATAPASDVKTYIDTAAPVDQNGNSVSLEREMVRMAENRQEHDLALTVYKSTLGILRAGLGRG
ncbi:FlgB family protein [Tropicimonas sp. S265A]|uniref:FlgB family protein n=1 Tax=Tropicimonas sp. S265A TaxID=3415134 RepID=UPI003C7E6DA6